MSLLEFLFVQLNLAFFYGVYSFLSLGKNHKVFNRFYLLIMPVVAIMLPFFSFGNEEASKWLVELPVIEVIREVNLLSRSSFSVSDYLYVFISATILLFFAVQFIRLLRWPKARFKAYFEGSKVYYLESNVASYSFFNRIFINPEQVENERLVLLHERAHCKQGHTWDVLVMIIFKSLFWFNPIIYLWSRKMKENHEFLADHSVMKETVSGTEYGRELLSSTFRVSGPMIGSAFNAKSLLHKRIENLNHKNQHSMKQLVIIPVIIGLAFLSSSMNIKDVNVGSKEVLKQAGINENEPEFPGGQAALQEFMGKHVKYPEALLSKNATGMVIVSFMVDKDGKIGDVKVARSSSYEEMDKEAVRVVKQMPNWNPGTKDGKAVKTEMKLPFKFAL